MNTPKRSAVVQVAAGGLEIRVIHNIRAFGAELDRLRFFDLEYSGQSRIDGPESRAEHGAGSYIAEGPQGGFAERGGIEPETTESSGTRQVACALVSRGLRR